MADEIVTDLRDLGEPKRRSIAIKQLARAAVKDLASGKTATKGLETGIAPLDKQFPALLIPANLIVIAGRPSMGKTALAQQIAEHVAEHSGTRALIYSVETLAEGLLRRAINRRTGIPIEAMTTGKLTKVQKQKFAVAAQAIESLSMSITDDVTDISSLVNDARAEAAADDKPLGLIVVDYLQLLESEGENRTQQVGSISKALKALAKRLRIPIIAVSQLSRKVESADRKDKRPMMSDLRESGDIEQDADVVLFPYRPDYYAVRGTTKTGTAELIVAKQRDGKTGTVATRFDSDRVSFG